MCSTEHDNICPGEDCEDARHSNETAESLTQPQPQPHSEWQMDPSLPFRMEDMPMALPPSAWDEMADGWNASCEQYERSHARTADRFPDGRRAEAGENRNADAAMATRDAGRDGSAEDEGRSEDAAPVVDRSCAVARQLLDGGAEVARKAREAGTVIAEVAAKGAGGTVGAVVGLAAGTAFGVVCAPFASARAAAMTVGANVPPDEPRSVTNAKALGLFGAGLVVFPAQSAGCGCVSGWQAGSEYVAGLLPRSGDSKDEGTRAADQNPG